jgi:ribokinase
MPSPTPSPALLSLGSINADFQVRVGEALGTSEVLVGDDLRRLGGGKAANVALLAQRLGCRVQLLGRVGNDDLAEQALAPLGAAGIDLGGVCRGHGGTAVSMIVVPPSGKKHLVLAGEANLGYDAADIAALEERIGTAAPGSILVADYEITVQAASRGVAAARARGLRVVIDPSFPVRVPPEDLRLAYALTPNAAEARALLAGSHAGDDPLESAARALAAEGPEVVCIKLENGGCLFWHEGRAWHLGAALVEVVDTAGAGDAITGPFAPAHLRGESPANSARRAVAASEVAVTV